MIAAAVTFNRARVRAAMRRTGLDAAHLTAASGVGGPAIAAAIAGRPVACSVAQMVAAALLSTIDGLELKTLRCVECEAEFVESHDSEKPRKTCSAACRLARNGRDADGNRARDAGRPSDPDDQKWCAPCQAWHPRAAFGLNRATKDGLNHCCRKSNNAASKCRYQQRKSGPAATEKGSSCQVNG